MTDRSYTDADLRDRIARALAAYDLPYFDRRHQYDLADAVLAVLSAPAACSDPIECSHEAALGELAELRSRLADYENRITWETTCGSCARVLDSSIRETERAERAEAAVARVRRLHDHLDSETDLLASPDQEITRGAAARKIAAALDGYSPPADRAAILREVADALPEADLPFVPPMDRRRVANWLRRLADAASGPGRADDKPQQPTDADVVEAHELALSFALNGAETQQPLVSTADKAAALGLTDTEYRARSHAAAVAAVRAAIPGMYAHVGHRLEDVLNEGGETRQDEPESLPLLFWDEPAGVVYEDGRIAAWLSRAVNLAQAEPAGQLILQPDAAARLRRALTTALNEADEAREAAERAAANCRDAEGCHRVVPCVPGCAARWQVAVVSQPDGEARSVCLCSHLRSEHVTVSGRLLCDACDPDSTDNRTCDGFRAL
ncbi:hypothetical protein ABT076_10690 [Streptomyces sp. NPDC002131]|uniref:hypothetical protein n=1 Tax=Streptomyces sp. NPDC002131 TaxID=3154535 RepID=UPI003327B725